MAFLAKHGVLRRNLIAPPGKLRCSREAWKRFIRKKMILSAIMDKNYMDSCEKRCCLWHHKQCTTQSKRPSTGSVRELKYIYRKI